MKRRMIAAALACLACTAGLSACGGKDTAVYSAPHYSFPVESIMRVERMACRDGSTEFEVTLQGGVLTMDVKAMEEVEDAEAKIA